MFLKVAAAPVEFRGLRRSDEKAALDEGFGVYLDLQSAQNSGPISQNRKHIGRIGSIFVGHFGGPGAWRLS